MNRWRGNPWASLITICLGFFMTLLDLTIVNIAIPSMMTGLSASLDAISWVLNAYLLVLVALLITAGRLGDVIGAKRLFIVGLVVFTIASAMCGFSGTIGELIAWRAIQGVGAAVMMPQTLTILTTSFPPAKRGTAFGIWGAVAGVATIAGPTLGGFLVTDISWRWIFFINVPVGIITFIMAIVLLSDVRLGRKHRLDIAGVVLSSLALLGLTYGIIEGQKYDWGTITGFISIPLVIAAGGVLLLAFLAQQWWRQRNEPLVPFALFANLNYSVMNFVAATVSVGMLGLMLPMTIYLQAVLGFSALKAGLVMAPLSVVGMFVAPVTGRLSDKIGGKYILFVGLLLFALGFGYIIVTAQYNSSVWTPQPGLIIAGLGVGCTFAPMSSVAMRDIEPRVAGAASGVMNTIRQLGSVIGNVAVIVLLQSELTTKLTQQAAHFDAAIPAQYRQRFVAGLLTSAKNGLAGGPTASSISLPPGTPAPVKSALLKAGTATFQHGYVDAMKPTLILPIVVVLVGALACLIARNGTGVARDAVAENPRTPAETTA
jgi:EmrB/QacA subfamily drug resistance transporter